MADKIAADELLRRLDAGTLTEADLNTYFIESDASAPFAPRFEFNPKTVVVPPPDALRGDIALASLNNVAQLKRRAEFHRVISSGYTGPRLAAEGDSWFQFPVVLRDIIDNIMPEIPTLCTSAAGDLLANMLRRREYIRAIQESAADVLLLSGGGNDVLAGGKIATFLHRFRPGLRPADYLRPQYDAMFNKAMGQYERICRDVAGKFPRVTVVCHGYDYPVPRNGRSLGAPMASIGIVDQELQRDIAAVMIDRFNGALLKLTSKLGNVRYVDCRGVVAPGGWHDELHPRNAGFDNIADRMLSVVKQALKPRTKPRRPRATDAAEVAAESGAQAISLHVGVNRLSNEHYGHVGLLKGCENDARAMQQIATAEGFQATMLLSEEATRDAVVAAISDAAGKLESGGIFLFTVSAHGGQVEDFNGDEERRDQEWRANDETLCLHDAQLIDDELFAHWSKFRPGVRIVMIADTCHSGSMIRAGMPAVTPDIDTGEPASFAERLAASAVAPRVRALPAEIAEQVLLRHAEEYRARSLEFAHVDEKLLTSPLETPLRASVLQIGACQDWELANDGDEYGAFTAALLNVWDRGRFDGDYAEFHRRIAEKLEIRTQNPQFIMLEPIDPLFPRQRPLSVFGGPPADRAARYAAAADGGAPAAPARSSTRSATRRKSRKRGQK